MSHGESPADSPGALEELAIFPLPDVVLFPGALLPLHVFEPRYRDLMADVLSGSRMFAVPRLRPGYQEAYLGRPPVFEVAGVGACLAADRMPDGRYNVMLRGVARVQIVEELPPDKTYRVVRTRLLPDMRSTRGGELPLGHQRLIALCDQLSRVLPEGGEALRQLARAAPTPGGCADVVASALVRDPDLRQTLLELLDPADRLDEVIAHLTLLCARIGRGGEEPGGGGRTLN